MFLFWGAKPANLTGARRFSKQDATPENSCAKAGGKSAKMLLVIMFPQLESGYPFTNQRLALCLYLSAVRVFL